MRNTVIFKQKMIMPFTMSRAFTKGLSTEDLTNLLETLNWHSTLKPLSSEQSEGGVLR